MGERTPIDLNEYRNEKIRRRSQPRPVEVIGEPPRGPAKLSIVPDPPELITVPSHFLHKKPEETVGAEAAKRMIGPPPPPDKEPA